MKTIGWWEAEIGQPIALRHFPEPAVCRRCGATVEPTSKPEEAIPCVRYLATQVMSCCGLSRDFGVVRYRQHVLTDDKGIIRTNLAGTAA